MQLDAIFTVTSLSVIITHTGHFARLFIVEWLCLVAVKAWSKIPVWVWTQTPGMLQSASSCHGVITETLWGKQLLSLQIVLATDVFRASRLSAVPLDSSWLISRLLWSLCPWGISLSLYLDWTSRSPVLLKVLCSREQRPCGVSGNHQSLLSFSPHFLCYLKIEA